jgi:serine/threonine protein kinase
MTKSLDNLCMGCMSISKTGSVCPHCGFDNKAQTSDMQVLAHGTILHKKFLIGRVLGKGGFGITYLAWDLILQTAVAIKEYMPFSLVTRDIKRPAVVPHSPEALGTFENGLRKFLQEARTLAQFSHANVVRVREFFPANNTGYLVMDYYNGLSLQQLLQRNKQKLTEQKALNIILPVLNGLAQVHQKGFLHRDIKPDNIYLVNEEHPILLDFGTASSASGQSTPTLSVVLTPGFAPFEQYLPDCNFAPSIDIYAVAATLYYVVSGVRPAEATTRLKNDPLTPLAELEPSLSLPFSNAVMRALAVYPEKRPQTVEDFQQQLTEKPAAPAFQATIAQPEKTLLALTEIAPAPANTTPPFTAAEQEGLTLTPVEKPPEVEYVPKRYESVYCPHCKTKNVVREDKPLSEAKCVKCRKTLMDKVKNPVPIKTLSMIGLLVLFFIGYRFINRETQPGQSTPPAMTPPVGMAATQNRQSPLPESGFPRALPQPAIDACAHKALHDPCVAESAHRQLAGLCENVGRLLLCIPGLPSE